MAKFCKNCGKDLNEGAKFCRGCGTTVESQASNWVQQPVAYQPPMMPPKKSRKKLVISITAAVIALAVIFTGISVISRLFGDRDGGSPIARLSESAMQNMTDAPDSHLAEITSETIRMPEQSLPFVVQQDVTALAVQQYITAWLYLEALTEFDMDTGSVEEFAELYDGTIEQFAVAEDYVAQAVRAAEFAQVYLDSGFIIDDISCDPSQGESSLLSVRPVIGNPFVLTAYADAPKGPQELKKWAQDIEAMANNAPAQYGDRGRLLTLAQQLGVDANTAGEMLKQAKTINAGGAAESEAERLAWWGNFHDAGMKTAMATKTTCKVVVLVGGTIATGGVAGAVAEGALATTALVVSSVDAIVEVGATASTIVLGENHSVTTTFNQVQDYIAPVAAVTGVLTLDFSKIGGLGLHNLTNQMSGQQLLGAVDYIGNSMVDYFVNDKIMGVDILTITDMDRFTKDITLSAVDVSNASLKGDYGEISNMVNELRTAVGLPKIPDPPLAPQPPLEKAKGIAPTVPAKSVDKYMNELLDWMVENGIVAAGEVEKYRSGSDKVDFTGTYSGMSSYSINSNFWGSSSDTGILTIKMSLTDENSNTYTARVIFEDGSSVTFVGQLNNRRFQSSNASGAPDGYGCTASLSFSENGDSVSGRFVSNYADEEFTWTANYTFDSLTKQ